MTDLARDGISNEAARRALESLLSEDTFPDFAYEPRTCSQQVLDEVTANNLGAVRRALVAALPSLRQQWEAERDPLMQRIDGLTSLIFYREGSVLSEQTRNDLAALMAEVQRITRARGCVA